MAAGWINRCTGIGLITLSSLALLTVINGVLHETTPLPPDEGTAAHIFQLAITSLLPMSILFVTTADWRQPLRSARPLVIATVVALLAFAGLYYLEHLRQ